MELFIPPEGARQFEYKKGPLPTGLRMAGDGVAPCRPDWVWVGEPVRNLGSCGCALVYPILIDALPDDMRRFANISNKRSGGYFVECNCRGKIIE